MNKGHLRDIILFTIMSNLKKKSIYVTTIIIAIICVMALPVFAYVSFSPDQKEDSEKIKKIYICDSTGYDNVDYESLRGLDKDYKDIKIENIDIEKSANIKANGKKNNRQMIKKKIKDIMNKNDKSIVITQVSYNDSDKSDTINVDIILPKNSKIKKSEGDKLGQYISQILTLKQYELAAHSDDELLELMTGVNVSVNTLGKGKEDHMFSTIKMFLPIIFSFVMYFMIMTYGQSLSNGMVTEKNSKIIELLVAHIKPGYLIVGKVLGCVIVALGQIFIWILSLIGGIYVSNRVGQTLKQKDFIPVEVIIDTMKKSNVESAFTIRAIIIFVVLLLLSFLFYCIFAAICGSFINKPDEASSVFAVYTYTNVLAFMVVYCGSFLEQKSLIAITRYIPFCTPYGAAADVLVGNITINQSIIIVLIMIISVVVILYLLSKVYERLVFNKLSLKELIRNKN
jgi:ABC-type Na+ efflux pump permease subunit